MEKRKRNVKKNPEREGVLLSQILRFLEMRRILHWRMPVQGVMRSSNGTMRFSKSPIAGFPDIAGIHHGIFFAMELKTQKGRATDLQLGWLRDIISAGGVASIVRSLEDAHDVLVEIELRAKVKENVLNIAS